MSLNALSPWRNAGHWVDLLKAWDQPGRLMSDRVRSGQPLVLGQTTVASTRVHLLSAARPGTVEILMGSDAGVVFYRRRERGQIVHLDVFHSEGDLDPVRLAPSLRKALFMAGPNFPGNPADFVDIQTGRGGGRLTGSLAYGLRPGLRETHRNHVHLTVLSSLCQPRVLPCLVAAAEWGICEQGLELRKVKSLDLVPPSESGQDLDLSQYQDSTDSFLRGSGDEDGGGDAHGSDLLAAAVQAADDLGGWSGAMELLELLTSTSSRRRLGIRGRTSAEVDVALRRLERGGYLRSDGEGLRLTGSGQRLARYARLHRQEIELKLRRMVRQLRQTARACLRDTPFRLSLPPSGDGVEKRAVRAESGRWLGSLAVAETVVAAASRQLAENRKRLEVRAGDLHVYRVERHRPVDLCLLVDASASMAGQRLRAARHLVQHLLLGTRDRVSVITFQEREVDIRVPLTRNYSLLDSGLSSIQAYGLTPLAEGPERAVEYLEQHRRRTALLILITDGIPTVPRKGLNPLEDALKAADRLCQGAVRFVCIGLKPNQTYLRQLAERAGGSLYILEELEEKTLVAIAYREREAIHGREPGPGGRSGRGQVTSGTGSVRRGEKPDTTTPPFS